MPTMIETEEIPTLLERHGGTLERRKGVYVVQLRGSYAQMGRQHAALAGAVCGDVAPQYFNRLIENMVAHAVPALAGIAGSVLKRYFHFRNRHRIGADMQAHLAGMAEGYGIDPLELERIFFVPDILHYLAGRAFPPLAVPPMCSGFFACGEATQGGKPLIGRNFDFFGRGVWNENNALIVMRPDTGQPYCWVGALGSAGSGQGFNSSGLVISLHTHFTRDVRTAGQPLFRMCHDVLSQCGTLEEAAACITAQPRMCGLTLFVADTKARTAGAVEYSATRAELIRPKDGLLVRTNHYVTDTLRATEVAPHPWQRNSRGRFDRVSQLLAEKRGTLTETDIPAIMSDCTDPYEGQRCVAGSIVAATNNAQSYTLSPEDDALWLGQSDYPVCHSSRFSGFRVSALLSGDRDNYEIDDLPGGSPLDETERAALTEYERAWTEFNDNLNSGQAVFHLRRAAALLPDAAVFPRMAGILLLKQKKYAQALPLLEENAARRYRDALTQAEAHVWAGRCLDLMGRREDALAQYRLAARLEAPPVSTAAQRHLDTPFKARQLFDVTPEFIVGTGLARY